MRGRAGKVLRLHWRSALHPTPPPLSLPFALWSPPVVARSLHPSPSSSLASSLGLALSISISTSLCLFVSPHPHPRFHPHLFPLLLGFLTQMKVTQPRSPHPTLSHSEPDLAPEFNSSPFNRLKSRVLESGIIILWFQLCLKSSLLKVSQQFKPLPSPGFCPYAQRVYRFVKVPSPKKVKECSG